MKKSDASKRKKRKAIIIAAIALFVLVAAGASTYLLATIEKTYPVTDANGIVKKLTIAEMNRELDAPTFYPEIMINGVDVSGKTRAEANAVFASDPKLDSPTINILMNVDGKEYPLDTSSIKISSNLTALIDEAYNFNRTSEKMAVPEDVVTRYEVLIQLAKTTKNYNTEYAADAKSIEEAVHRNLDTLEITPVDAKAISFDKESLLFVLSDSSAGRTLDIDTAIADVKAAFDAKEYTKTITVAVTTVEPKVSQTDLAATLDLVSSTTTKTADNDNRNTNINLVCKTIDGLMLQPGEVFNYNEYVGKRTAEKGYMEAGAIINGASGQELGGGICQVSGTLFHSVMKADLQVDERYPHTWPSTYVDIGTDATVTWDGQNFQFTNNTAYPVAIHAYYKDLKVTIQIFGCPVEGGMTIKIEGIVLSTTPPGPTEYVADPLSPVGKNTTDRAAHNKIEAQWFKIYNKDDIEIKREMVFASLYRAITAKINVGCMDPITGAIYAVDPLTGIVDVPTPSPVPTIVPPVETLPTVDIPVETPPTAPVI